MECKPSKISCKMLYAYCSSLSLIRFRWVVLRGSSQPGMARKVLKCVATTLDATYDQMLLGIAEDCQDQVFMALQWLDFSARPLLITELAEAVVVNPQGNPRLDPDDRLLAPAE